MWRGAGKAGASGPGAEVEDSQSGRVSKGSRSGREDDDLSQSRGWNHEEISHTSSQPKRR